MLKIIVQSFTLLCLTVTVQAASLGGLIKDAISNEPLPYATVALDGTSVAVSSDEAGKFLFDDIQAGTYNVSVRLVGYQSKKLFNVLVNGTRRLSLEISMEPDRKVLGEVTINAGLFNKIEEAPISVYGIGEAEIKRNPGGNRDISKAIQSLPGVAAVAGFRNDLIIRGGSSNENRFYLDGIEIPNINHFSTQGATGGPVGLINVDFIRSVDFFAGSFPSNRGNALSSVMDFKLKEGRSDRKAGYAFTLGASDLALTADGSPTEKSNFIVSYRRSYLQFLFQLLQLPFLPTYDDAMVRYKFKIDDKNELTILALGALDRVRLNTAENESEQQKIILETIPRNNQWNYTTGLVYKHYRKSSYATLVLSRNELNNEAIKYKDNNENNPSGLILNYNSRETENKIRLEHTARTTSLKINGGILAEYVNYTNSTFNRLPFVGTIDYSSAINFFKYGFFGQASGSVLKRKLGITFGFRADGNTFNSNMANVIRQLSPRVSFSYDITSRVALSTNIGRYYQLPAYTILGYRNNAGTLVNRSQAKYVSNDQIVLGVSYTSAKALKISIEAFVKKYKNYPFDLKDSVSIANLGSDFGVIGNVPVAYNNDGIARGVELLLQQRLNKSMYGILAYTFVNSEFETIEGNLAPSSWDFRHIVSATAGKYFKRNWELGMRYRYNSGAPYTPINIPASSIKSNFDITGGGIPDFSRVNSLRTNAFQQLDMRIDKKYFFKSWSLNIFLDIQNITNSKTLLDPTFTVQRDANGTPLTDPQNPDAYLTKFLSNESGSTIPTIGLIIEF